MSYRVGAACTDCGFCVQACPWGAIRHRRGRTPAFEVRPVDCNDCGSCAVVCPAGALALDPEWPVCRGRGCPLSSRKFMRYDCTEGIRGGRCPACGGPLWKAPAAEVWTCPACDAGRKAICQKVGKLWRIQASEAARLAEGPVRAVPVGIRARGRGV